MSELSAVELLEEMEKSVNNIIWNQLYAEDKPGLTVQQQGERSAFNTGVYRSTEALRAYVKVNLEHLRTLERLRSKSAA